MAYQSELMPAAASRVNRPEAVAYKEEPARHGGGWRGNRSGGCGRSRAAAHGAKSDVRTHRPAKSGVASCFDERSLAIGMSPCRPEKKRDGDRRWQRDACRRRGNEAPARVRRKAVCSRLPSGARKADGSNSGTAWAEPGHAAGRGTGVVRKHEPAGALPETCRGKLH